MTGTLRASDAGEHPPLDVYSTCAPGSGPPGSPFRAPFADTARWSEAAGLTGLLIFTDNSSVDPWAAAQYILSQTEAVTPLVAVQPLYMHPYTAARMVSTLASLYARRIDLNLVTGGYRPHLAALGCGLDHDSRYIRLQEYGRIMTTLLAGEAPSHTGRHFTVTGPPLEPPLPSGFAPRVFVAGSSPAAAETADALGAVRLAYPRRLAEYTSPAELAGTGIRFGIIARDTSAEAWRIAHTRYPDDPVAEAFREYASLAFQAQWHQELWRSSARAPAPDVYWLHPFRVSNEFCPFLVGSHAEVAEVLAGYLAAGVRTLIVNTPQEEDDLFHVMAAVDAARTAVPHVT